MTRRKRVFDLVFATSGLVITAPLFAVAALSIKLEDGGPIFFRQNRVGYRGAIFRIWKFRTMVVEADRKGPQLTVAGDPRITTVGRWLRKCKLDELPQLLNVLAGEMSFVGPRPEVQKYVAMYNEDQRGVLMLVPGITDPASIRYYDEGNILALSQDPERRYVEDLMPEKISLNLLYAENATVVTDILVLVKTVVRVLGLDSASPESAASRRNGVVASSKEDG